MVPHWLDRQQEPSSPSFVAPGAVGPDGRFLLPPNVTARNWTTIGNLDSPWESIVDPRGLLTPWPGGWSLDWWAGADDRWRMPSREVAVRQRLVDDMPVVETAMRVPSGDLVHRAYAVRAGAEELVVVELENQSPIPMALALSVRPFGPEGLAPIERIALHDGLVTVDGRPALILPKPPARVASSTAELGDAASIVTSGSATETFQPARCPAGLASAAFIWPLAHRQTMRFAVPLAGPARARRGGSSRRPVKAAPTAPELDGLPASDQVARGWRLQGDRGVRLVLPDQRLRSAVDANRRFLLLMHDGAGTAGHSAAGRPFRFSEAVDVVGALDRFGYDQEAAAVLASYADRQRSDGSFAGGDEGWGANGAALFALAEHWRLHRDEGLVRDVAPVVARAAEWIEKKRHGGGAPGLFPAGAAGPAGPSRVDDLWGVRGLLDAGELLAAAGEDEAAAAAGRFAMSFRADLDASLAGTAGSLAAGWPLRLADPDDARLSATVEGVRDRSVAGAAVFDALTRSGLDTRATIDLAFAEMEAGDQRALGRLEWLLEAATPTWTWPEAVHPRLPGGSAGDGHDRRVVAGFLSFVRSMLVRETPAGGLALVSLLPDHWLGQGIEVHGAPTHFGTVSFAVRWHGERPALLWELEPYAGVADVAITAPGLDPAWSSADRRGDALLSPVQGPGTPVKLSRKT